ncbi:hypothetical protein ACFQMA_09325 [Halosimplex aquaticum]|uniref:Uncharacterized protein n=1 Tax=Halosimplex aquaticum TaxID=3026162 RepID=A0ABD5XY37_9EURY|nr:hypothetical protein [Halosimplex aquaticum]
MVFGGAKEKMMERTVANSDAMKAVSTIIAGLEVELLSEVKRLEDAAGVDHLDEVPTQEERQETLLGLVQAKIGGDGTDFYAEEVMSEHVENPEDAAAYLSLEPEEWEEQISNWAETYRAKGVSEDLADREIADQHVQRKFGVSLGEFETNVVEWDQRAMMEKVLAGNVSSAVEGVRLVRESLED